MEVAMRIELIILGFADQALTDWVDDLKIVLGSITAESPG